MGITRGVESVANELSSQEIKRLLQTGMETEHVEIGGDGYHVDVLVVSRAFEGLRPVKRQQLVYAALQAVITDGSLHAVNMKTFTPAEYAAVK